MKLRFKKGAVVRFELIGAEDKVGKVENVFDDEVVVVEQISVKIKKDKENKDAYLGLSTSYDQTRSVDGKETHINRALISSWEYANLVSATKNVYDKTYLTKATFTYYDENGYCYGDGIDFSNIPDSSSSYGVIGAPKDDSDGLELSL